MHVRPHARSTTDRARPPARPRPPARWVCCGLAAGAALLGGLAVPAAAVPPAPPAVGRDVAAALALAAPAYARVDLSTNPTGTRCIAGPTAQPLVYRNDRIVLRTAQPGSARAVVNQALGAGSPVTAGVPEVIELPQSPAAGRTATARTAAATTAAGHLRPIVSVPLVGGEGHVDIVLLARTIRQRTGLPASPDYLLSPTGPVGMWPDGNPTDTPALEPARPDSTLGRGVEVWVYDTGLPNDRRAWSPQVQRLTPQDVERPDLIRPAADVVDFYSAGHTLAIAGVLEVMAPSAAVKAARITEAGGVATDVSAARRMASTLSGAATWPQVIVNSFGSPACDASATPGDELVPLGLQAVSEAVTRRGGTVITAAAGNRSSQRRFYPAAFDQSAATGAVLGIGALDATSDSDPSAWSSASRTALRAEFSNSGSWVHAWAPGVGLATRHVVDLSFPGARPLVGRAKVNGTSFATPYVAGLLASQISQEAADGSPVGTGKALADLLASGRPCSGGGGGLALALTAKDADADATSKDPIQC